MRLLTLTGPAGVGKTRLIIRWSRVYPGLVNPGVYGILCALESMGSTEDATFW